MTDPILRPWTSDDAPALVTAYRGDADLAAQFGDVVLSTESTARAFISLWLVGADAAQRHWAIAENGTAVGSISLSAIEWRHETAWISYWLAGPARGRGYATRALASVTEWAFATGIFRLELGHRVDNAASCRVARQAGYACEGIERQKLTYGVERFDVELHSRLRTDPAPPTTTLKLAC